MTYGRNTQDRSFKRKDGICLGVFPKMRNEIVENSALTRSLTATTA
jgi:hypothetical protein